MMFNATFNIVSVISQKPLTYLYISWVSPEKNAALKCLVQGPNDTTTFIIIAGTACNIQGVNSVRLKQLVSLVYTW